MSDVRKMATSELIDIVVRRAIELHQDTRHDEGSPRTNGLEEDAARVELDRRLPIPTVSET
jgi:hypothetical protein